MNRLIKYMLLAVTLILFSCDFGSEPDDPPKNPREYSWTVDTLANPESIQTHMRSIWGSSVTDVYVAGFNASGGGNMYHYDGEVWEVVGLHVSRGGNITKAIDLTDVYGFSSDDIWAVGAHTRVNRDPPPNFLDSSFIMHYDGVEWWEVDTPSGKTLHSMHGAAPDDIWAGGREGTLFHYDGVSWKSDSIPVNLPVDYDFFTYFNTFSGNEPNDLFSVYWIIFDWGYLLSYDGFEWSVEDSFYWEDHVSLWTSPAGKLYSVGESGVNLWEDGGWISLLGGGYRFIGISGTSDENIFVTGLRHSDRSGVIFHYNGVDWYQYDEPDSLPPLLIDVWTDGNEVFIVGYTTSSYPEKSIILHGR